MVFGPRTNASPREPDRLATDFSGILLETPWRDESLPSLVCEDDHGAVVGFLGVVPRPMVMDGQRVRVAVSSRFMVHPERRGRAGLQLLKRFFAGAQDLSITEGNNLTRLIWEGRGGITAQLYSLRWTRPLRPSRYVLSFLERHGMRSRLAPALTPLARALDGLGGWLRQWPCRPSPSALTGEELTADALLAGLADVTRGRALRPEYDNRSLPWLLQMLAEKQGRGRLRKMLVRRAGHDAVGWYLYYANPAGIGEVVQVAAKDGAMGDVLRHLFHDAWEHGALAVSGQLDPAFIQAFADEHCLLHGGGGSWILAHSRRAELLDPLYRGDAFLTRLEGEWWTGL